MLLLFFVLTTHCHRRRRQSLMSLINSTSAILIEFNLSFLILFSFCYRFLLNLENMISFLRRVFFHDNFQYINSIAAMQGMQFLIECAVCN